MSELKTKAVTRKGIGWSADMTPEKFDTLVSKRTSNTPYSTTDSQGRLIERKCSMCGEWMALAEFYPTKTGRQRRHIYCIPCCSIRARGLRYGLTIDQVQALIRLASGHCQLCGRLSEQLLLDHCHATGKVRGMLCPLCNTALAAVDKIPSFLDLARVYVAR